MGKMMKVNVVLAREKLAVPAVVTFDEFEDPLVGMEKLVGTSAEARIERAEITNALRVKGPLTGTTIGSFTLQFEPGDVGEKLMVRFARQQPVKLKAMREGDLYSVVINHEA